MKLLTYLFIAVLSLTAAVEAGGKGRKFVKGGTILDIDTPNKRSIPAGPRGVRELIRGDKKE